MSNFYIENRLVGNNAPPLVVVEIGINHGGSLEVAKKMVDAAYKAGAEVIKHQTHIIEDEMTPEAKKVIPGNASKSIYEIMKECALSEEEEYELMQYVKSKGMIFISTPFSRAAADRLRKFNIPAYKIGSGECNNYPLIKHIASFGKPIILSTGMNNIESIKKAAKIIEDAKIPYALLHCTNVYPTPYELIRLDAITELKENFPNAVVGLSDHSLSNYPCLGAVALGSSILERHFTDSKRRKGPDIACSMTPKELKDLIKGSEIIYKSKGRGKILTKEEKSCSKFAFATVVAIKDIKKGEKFTTKNIWVKRPGIGEIKAEEYENILGKTSKKDIKKDKHLSYEDIL